MEYREMFNGLYVRLITPSFPTNLDRYVTVMSQRLMFVGTEGVHFPDGIILISKASNVINGYRHERWLGNFFFISINLQKKTL